MPPNRQGVASLARTLSAEHLASFVQTSKFPPLTQQTLQRQEEKKEREECTEQRRTTDDDAKLPATTVENYWDEYGEEAPDESYWDWPQLSPRLDSGVEEAEAKDLAAAEQVAWTQEVDRRRAVVANILAEEEARKIVSLDSIETNLKRDAERRSREAVIAKIVADEEARRAVSLDSIEANLLRDAERRRSEEGGNVIGKEEVAEKDGYWDWNDENDVPPERNTILRASHIEEMLKKESRRIDIHSRVGLQRASTSADTQSNNYWEWRTLTKDQEKVRIIESILEDERARLLLQASHLESNLKDASRASTTKDVCHGEESKEDYWCWNENTSPQPSCTKTLVDPAASPPPSSGTYWDWSPPQTKETRQIAVESILRNEEARLFLTADRLVENLKADTWRRAKEEVDAWYSGMEPEVQQPEGSKQKESYWDM